MLVAAASVAAQSSAILTSYAYSHEMLSSELQDDDYRLVLGAMEKINGQWRPEREQRLAGQLQRKTLTLNEGRGAAEGYEFYRQQLLQRGARELFSCEARACGSSNSWANNIFRIKQLYGRDQQQFYSAFELPVSRGMVRYVALYSVTRGNKRSLIQIDSLLSRSGAQVASSVEVMVERLQLGESIRLPGLELVGAQITMSEVHAASLLELMRKRPTWHLNLVGHDAKPVSTEEQLKNSRAFSEQLRSQLINLGADADRLKAFGIGNLAPRLVPFASPEDAQSFRVELVKGRVR